MVLNQRMEAPQHAACQVTRSIGDKLVSAQESHELTTFAARDNLQCLHDDIRLEKKNPGPHREEQGSFFLIFWRQT